MSKRVSQRQHAVKSRAEDSGAAGDPSRRTPAGDALTALLEQVIPLTRHFTDAGEQLAKPSGQTLARWIVLETIAEAPASVAQIARMLHLARQSVQRVADVLVREELAVYEENPRHRRAKLLVIRPKGRSVLRTIRSVQRAWADELGGEIGEADLRQAIAILSRVSRVVVKHLTPRGRADADTVTE